MRARVFRRHCLLKQQGRKKAKAVGRAFDLQIGLLRGGRDTVDRDEMPRGGEVQGTWRELGEEFVRHEMSV